MNKDYLNNILYFCFKFGKVFAVIALILLFLTMIGAGIYLLRVGNYKINLPQFSVIKQQIEISESGNSYSDNNQVLNQVINKEKTEKKYAKTIEKIIFECNLKPFSYDMILTNLMRYDEKYQREYLEALEPFILEGQVYLKDKYKIDLSNVENSKNILRGLLDEYNTLFEQEISRIDGEKSEQLISKIVSGSILVIAILLFVICLFLPLLIKIEENTRDIALYLKENNNEI